ncbi:MAG: AEC family transporter [Atopobiaceae bacterium]|jgi:auxin efflux carrier (AEC)
MTALLSSIESILPVLLIIALGFVLQGRGWFSDQFGPNISRLILNVAMPASIFVSVLSKLTLGDLASDLRSLLAGFGSVALCYVIAFIVVKVLHVRPGRRGLMINMFANANTIFVGMPLNIALFGESSMQYYLMYYIVNTVSTWTVGALLILSDPINPAQGTEGTEKNVLNWKKLLPAPLVGFLVSLVFLVLAIPLPSFVTNTLSYVGELVTPLSLIYIGIVLNQAGLTSIRFDRDTIVALVGRFLVAPLTMLVALRLVGIASGTEYQTFMVQSAIAGLAVLPILANEGRGDVGYATNVVTTSTILFAVIVPVLMTIIG